MMLSQVRSLMDVLRREAPKWCPDCERNVTQADRHAPDCPSALAPEPLKSVAWREAKKGLLVIVFTIGFFTVAITVFVISILNS